MSNDARPEIEQYNVLRLEYDTSGNARLTVAGPKAPVIGLSPVVGIGRDAKGNYNILIGGDEWIHPANEIPGELRRLLGDSGAPKGPPPNDIKLPKKNNIHRLDGSFKTYEEYQSDCKRLYSPVSNLGGSVCKWDRLPRELYQLLIDFYSGKKLSRPPHDPGDFPLPSGDTAVA